MLNFKASDNLCDKRTKVKHTVSEREIIYYKFDESISYSLENPGNGPDIWLFFSLPWINPGFINLILFNLEGGTGLS